LSGWLNLIVGSSEWWKWSAGTQDLIYPGVRGQKISETDFGLPGGNNDIGDVLAVQSSIDCKKKRIIMKFILDNDGVIRHLKI